jgi:signal transduction histidine kinase
MPRPKKRSFRASSEDDRLRRMQRLAMQGELAATAVHEMSNLQTIVLFNAGLLREKYPDDPAIRMHLDPLLHAATMIASMCGQLRNLAHPLEPQAMLMDLGEISHGAFSLLEKIVGRELVFERTDPEPILVVADPTLIEQMLINLVLNARDATAGPKGRIVVRVGRQSAGRSPCLEIEDNGSGMTPEVRRRLFTKFFTTKPLGRGTGLGLVTVQRSLRGMGGRIEVRSRLGRGTRMRLIFPSPSARLARTYRRPAAELRWSLAESFTPAYGQSRVS